jgi:hypothetical protein
LDATTGSLLWTQNLGAAVASPENGGNALQFGVGADYFRGSQDNTAALIGISAQWRFGG